MIRKTLTILSLIDLLLVVLSGCSARRIYVSGDRGIHPCVKWVFRSGDQSAYFLWIVMLEQEDFDDAALFGDRLLIPV